MKNFKIISLVVLALVLISSECGRPDMLVINKVNEDGSVNRKLVITYDEDEFDLDDMQVPVDSSWTLEKTIEVSEKGDSLWTITAEKYFASVEDLNYAYNNHKGTNDKMTRSAVFEKHFKWFNTVYFFSENVEKAIDGYPPEDFFGEEYLDLFYMPEKIFNDFRYGEDSLRYKAMVDTLEEKKEIWFGRSLVKAAITELDSLIQLSGGSKINISDIREKEEEMAEIIFEIEDIETVIDTLLGKGYYIENQVTIDSALKLIEKKLDVAMSTNTYLVQTKMPGELVGTNGYIDTEGAILWEVNSDVIFTRDYSMWARSTVSNLWAWIVSGLFVIFVVLSIVLRRRRS